jgi:hypothetical protein
MKNVGGIFVTVIIGCTAAITLGFTRWIMNIRLIAKKFDIPFKEAFHNEFGFFKQFGTNVKQLPQKNSSQIDSVHSSNGTQSRAHSRSTGINPEPLRMSLKSLNHKGKGIPDDDDLI